MRTSNLLTILLSFFCLAFANAKDKAPTQKPNVLLILTDDMGYGDLSIQGSKQVATPNIDRIAEEGAIFTQAYATGAVCAPSRCGLLSGMYQNRFGAEHNWNDFGDIYNSEYIGIDSSLTILSDYIDANNYATAMIGKWHVGETKAMLPNARGFDFSFMIGGHHSYFPKPNNNKIKRDGQKVTTIDVPYLTDWFTKEAMDWMTKDHQDEPWFVYLAYNTPHTPMHAKEEDLKKYEHITDKKRQTYLAMQDCLNQNIGQIYAMLEATGQLENTLIIFTNDNGGACPSNAAINAPLRGEKSTYLEGGIRVPMFISWPGKIKAGMHYDKPVTLMDLTPTILAAIESTKTPEDYEVKTAYPTCKLDGVNLFPYINGKKGKEERPHETIYWRTTLRGRAIRDGDWKLIETMHDLPMLYNLAEDMQESNNLLLENPEKARELKVKMAAWEASLEATPRFFNKNQWMKTKPQQYNKEYIMVQPE